jgi:flavin reductase (DIM6/NTAB) family NADH-FMN oxidoreductase RutF
MKPLDFFETIPQAMRQITRGAFLTVKAGDDINIMTIGWASLGYIWRKNIVTVVVRTSRHTFGIIERAADFTLSAPLTDQSKALGLCGTLSGKNCNKFEKSGLQVKSAQKTVTPISDIPGIHYECRIVYASPMTPARLAKDYVALYPDKDFHTMYYGEVMACYSNEDE